MAERADQHLDAATIAELDADLLEPGRVPDVAAHLAACADCRRVQEELAELREHLAAAPAPPMPVDVAIRLTAALEREAEERHRSASAAEDSRVVALTPRWRRWLAPLAAAGATVVVGVAVVGQVLDEQFGGAGSADTAAEAGGAGDGLASGPEADQEMARRPGLLVLSTDTFRRDVVREVYGKDAAGQTRRDLAPAEGGYTAGLACDPRQAADVPNAAVAWEALLDGRPAVLFVSGPRSDRVAVAVTCEGGRPSVAARARLPLN